MKGVCVKSTPPSLHDTSVPSWLQPRTKPRSRRGVPNMLSSESFTKGFSPGGSPPDKNTARQMFVRLGPRLRPPMTSCALWKRNSRSTLNSTVWPCDPRVYLVGSLCFSMDGSTGRMSRCCGLESWRWSSALVTVNDKISPVRTNSTPVSGEAEKRQLRVCQSHGTAFHVTEKHIHSCQASPQRWCFHS